MALTKQQKKFADLYMETNEMGKSYMKAFPTCKSMTSASAAASRMVKKNESVVLYLQACETQATTSAIRKAEISKERVLKEEGHIAFLDPADMLDELGAIRDLNDLPEEVRRGIKSIAESTVAGVRTLKITFYDKGKSLDRLEKCLKMQSEGIDVGGALTLKLIIESIDGRGRGKLPQES